MAETLFSNQLSGGGKGISSQRYVDVDEIQNGVIVLKDGSLRAVLLVASVNFDLKSSEEQDAIIMQYQSFLNSLDFPVQILINSRRLNIDPYIELLKQKTTQQENELLKMQISEYMMFIRNLTDSAQIMSKYFYLVVPFHSVENIKKGALNSFVSMFSSGQGGDEKQEKIELYKNQLWQRVDQVKAGLGSVGLKTVPLKTDELIELLYNAYNPGEIRNNSIKEVDSLEVNEK